MPRGSDSSSGARAAFTLVELVLVMAILVVLLAVSAPALTRSARGRRLNGEAARLLALTEYARDEAISQGVPMIVWMEPDAGAFGVEAKAGYPANVQREKEYILAKDIEFDLTDSATSSGGHVSAIVYGPDGTPDSTSLETIRIMDRRDASITLTRTRDGLGYEILKEGRQ